MRTWLIKPVQRQESSPDDARSHERDHLRQEEDRPGHRPQPARRDSVDDAGRHESERDRDEAIEETSRKALNSVSTSFGSLRTAA